jgi:hypothetical protein
MDARTRAAGVISAETLLSYDGLSFLKALLDGKLPPPPITETMGFRLSHVEAGRIAFEGWIPHLAAPCIRRSARARATRRSN